MSMPGEATVPLNPGVAPNAPGTGNPGEQTQTGENYGANPGVVPAGPMTQGDMMLAQLTQATIQNAQLQAENALMIRNLQDIITNMNNPKPKEINVSAPNSFDGKPKNYPSFISSIITQFRADPARYSTPARKIYYTLSHMKEGVAALWARRMITSIENGLYKIETWEDFEALMRLQFDSVHRKLDAQRNLASFKQGSKTAEEFFTQFEDYKADAEFNEETILFFLRDNVNPGITSKIVFMPNQPKTYEAFKDAAYFFDRQYREHKERTKSASTPTSQKPKPPTTPSTTTTNTPSDTGVPMDVDRLRAMAHKFPDVLCYNCEKMGHYSSSCPEPRTPRTTRHLNAKNTSSSSSSSNASSSRQPTSSSSTPPKPDKKVIRQLYDELDVEEKANFIRTISQDFLQTNE